MQILLNVTRDELRTVSGDVSFFRDLLAADATGAAEYVLVDDGVQLLREAPKAAEHIAAHLPSSALRRRLFQVARHRSVSLFRGAPRHDVILSHITFPAFAQASIPVIWSSQGLSPPEYYEAAGPVGYHDVIELYERYSRRAAALMVWTHSGAERLEHDARLSAPIVVLPPVLPVRVPDKSLARKATTHVLFVGRDAQRKGLYELVAACESLAAETKDWTIDIVSAPTADLAARIDALSNATLHVGPTDEEVSALMERADILALPTRAETYGYVLIEAMAHSCALVTTDSPPMNELVTDGVNGAVAAAGDVSALTDCLRHMLSDSSTLATMKANSKQRYEEMFAPEVVLPKYHRLFTSVHELTSMLPRLRQACRDLSLSFAVIPRGGLVLEVGSGDQPFARSDILCDRFVFDDTERVGPLVADPSARCGRHL